MNVAPVASQRTRARDWLDWPFFDASHRAFAEDLDRFVASGVIAAIDRGDVDASCRRLVRALGELGLLSAAVAPHDGDATAIDLRRVCLARETLAAEDGLLDFAFAMQGLGSGAVAIAGSPEQRALVLPKVRRGEWLAAFALSEKDAGSDVAAMACAAREEGNGYRLDGEKTWISNGGIADFYTVFARTGEAPGARGISAFVGRPRRSRLLDRRADRGRWRRIRWRACASTAAAFPLLAGSARRAKASRSPCARSISSAPRSRPPRSASRAARSTRRWRTRKSRRMFGETLADLQLTQAALADMATEIDAAALLTYRAAWLRDVEAANNREAAMAKMTATETAQRVIDRAVQMFGGLGVKRG